MAPPAEIYERPSSRWVADFVGDINLFQGRLGDDGLTIEGTAAGRLRVAAKPDAEPGTIVWAAVRPEKVRISRDGASPDQANCIVGTVVDLGYLGSVSIYKVRIRDGFAGAGSGRQCRRPRTADRLRGAGVAELAGRRRDRADVLR